MVNPRGGARPAGVPQMEPPCTCITCPCKCPRIRPVAAGVRAKPVDDTRAQRVHYRLPWASLMACSAGAKRRRSHYLPLDEVATQSGWRPRIAIRAIHDAGNLASAIEKTNLLHRFHPRFAFLCGIAGNVNHEKRHLGDVVVSSSYAYRLATRMSEGKRIEWAMPSAALYLKKPLDIFSRGLYRCGWKHRTRSSGL